MAAERPLIDVRSLLALIGEWLIVVSAIVVVVQVSHWAAWLAAMLVVATRQHALLMLFHDAVHGLLARDRRANDFLINLLVGVPHLLPVETYRPLHLAHHRAVGTDEDPERTLLYAGQRWRYRPLPAGDLAMQLLGDLFLVNGLRTLAATHKRGGVAGPEKATLVALAIWALLLAAVFARWPQVALPAAVIWFVPLLTITNLLQKLRSFAEHSGGPGVTPGWDHWTYSWRPGLLGRLTIWPYNINYHLEHHANATLPWHQLPRAAAASGPGMDGDALPSLLFARAGRESD